MKLIIDIPEEEYKRGTLCEYFGCWSMKLHDTFLNGTPIPDNATPCDFCRFNPPSSTDGKPCCMCPATGKG